jgi:TorA maturation chaperone TorD
MMENPDTVIARSACYKLLSLAFLPPRTVDGEELFAGFEKIIRELPSEHQAILRPIIEEALIPRDAPSEQEHTRLFGVGLAATPYESEYDPLASARKGHCLADLLGFYEAFGFRLADHQGDFPDHIAIELEFMSLLLLKVAHARAESLEEEWAIAEDASLKFLSDHLAAWSPLFADRVETATEEEFYRFAARLLRGFLDAECQLLGVEPVPLATVPKDPGPLTCPFAPECSELSGSV